MKYTTETVERKILGPYTGKHIAGSSSHVYNALATIEYRFDGFTVRMADVPVRWDEEQQRQFMSGQVGVDVSRRLQDIEYAIKRKRFTDRIEEHKRQLAELLSERERLQEELRQFLSSTSNEPGDQASDTLLEEVVRSAIFNAPIRASLKAPDSLLPAA